MAPTFPREKTLLAGYPAVDELRDRRSNLSRSLRLTASGRNST
jgi:hypothetical protein